MVQRWAMHTPLCPGGRGKTLPLPQCCTLPAHEKATLPCVSRCDNYVIIAIAVAIAIAIAITVSVAIAITIAVAVGHRRHRHHCHHCCHCHRRLRWPLSSPLPLQAPSPPENKEALIGELLPWRSDNYI